MVRQDRPDDQVAPIRMDAIDVQTYVDAFGQTHTTPTGYDFLTATSANGRGETQYTIESEPITLDGSTYVHRMIVSDRKLGPQEAIIEITGTNALTLSYENNGDLDGSGGTGRGFQPNEFVDVLHSGGDPDGNEDLLRYNPTRDGSSAIPYQPGPPYDPEDAKFHHPERDNRVHGSMPIYFRAEGNVMETCVYDLEFGNPGYEPLGPEIVASRGDNATDSILYHHHRCYHKITLGWGPTKAIKAVTQRHDWSMYYGTRWDNDTVAPHTVKAAQIGWLYSFIGGYFNKARLVDLGGQADDYEMPPFFMPQAALGADNFQSIQANREFLLLFDNDGVLVGGDLREPEVASQYACLIYYNDVTNLAIGFSFKMSSYLSGGEGFENIFPDEMDPLPAGVSLSNFWRGADELTAPSDPDGRNAAGAHGMLAGFTAHNREAGWLGSVYYLSVGRLEHVLDAAAGLYESGALDARNENHVPQAIREGTYWPTDPLRVDHLKARIRRVWEATGL